MSPRPSSEPSVISGITDRTKVKIGLAGFLSVCGTIVWATWQTHNFFDDFKNEQESHFQELRISQASISADLKEAKNSLNYKVTTGQFNAFMTRVDQLNRNVSRKDGSEGLNMPDALVAPAIAPLN